MKNLQYSVPFILQELYFEVCLSVSLKSYLSIRRWVIIPKIEEQRQKFFSVEVDRTFLKMWAKDLVKVTKIGKLWAERDHLL